MNDPEQKGEHSGTVPARHNVRLPGFIADEPVGLGDLVKRMTYLAGIEPCGGCEQRARILNRLIAFGPKNKLK